MPGKVYLVGAGPGDPELLTMKALKVLKEADVVLYDNLVSEEVLEYAESAKLIYVGKKMGHHFCPQERINQLLVENAQKYRVVVRLKGGDPLIFGRIAEEMEALEEAGIDYEIIPGVTAASAAASVAKVPLTHRDYTSIVSFISGHRKRNMPLDIPYKHLVELGGTVVVYMGVSTMKEIVKGLMDAGLDGNTPVLVAKSVGLKDQLIIRSTVSDMLSLKDKITPPAVWIVGKVVEFTKKIGDPRVLDQL